LRCLGVHVGRKGRCCEPVSNSAWRIHFNSAGLHDIDKQHNVSLHRGCRQARSCRQISCLVPQPPPVRPRAAASAVRPSPAGPAALNLNSGTLGERLRRSRHGGDSGAGVHCKQHTPISFITTAIREAGSSTATLIHGPSKHQRTSRQHPCNQELQLQLRCSCSSVAVAA
jgi:hypothetical protein